MDPSGTAPMAETETQDAVATVEGEAIDFAAFLVTCPPNSSKKIADLGEHDIGGSYILNLPTIQLPCDNEECGGRRMFFDCQTNDRRIFLKTWDFIFVTYTCRHCNTSIKQYAIGCLLTDESGRGKVHKYGEFPPFGERIPPGVLRLIQPDIVFFRQGLRAENLGLGIGAFGYYRRVVERQKDRLFDRIISVARSINFPADRIEALGKAKASFQFESSVKEFKDLIPQSLLIKGHNPLTLLHRALSRGIHSDSDAECLELAHDIRAILTELEARAAEALRSDAAIGKAISHLTGQGARKELN